MAKMARTDRRKLLSGDKRRVWVAVRNLGRPHTAAFVAELLNMDTERCYASLFSLRTSRYLKFERKKTPGGRGRFYFEPQHCMIPRGESAPVLTFYAQCIMTSLLNLGQATPEMIAQDSGYARSTILDALPQLKQADLLSAFPARLLNPLAGASEKCYGLTPMGIEMAICIEEKRNG